MAEAIYKQEGDHIDYVPAADVAAGEVVVIGELVGVAHAPIAAGELGALTVRGVFAFAKATGGGTAIAAGAKVYWNDTDNVATTDAAGGSNKYLGKAVAAASDSVDRVLVLLQP
jgi:predicted RecA/RadA family phage recombinase